MTIPSTSRERARETSVPFPPACTAAAARSRAAANLGAMSDGMGDEITRIDGRALTTVGACGTVGPMSEIELAPLSHRLDEEEMRTLAKLLVEAGAPPLDKADEHASHTIAARISEEARTEFLARLDAHDLGAEIYVPLEFEGRVTIGDFRVASSQALFDVLEEMREELSVDADDKDAEDEDEGTVIEAQRRHIFHLVAAAATESIEKSLPLHLQL